MAKNFTLTDIASVLKLNESIEAIKKSASLKPGVKQVCDKYTSILESGVYEGKVASQFVAEMSKFSSISSVNTQLSLLEGRVNNKKNKNNILMVSTLSDIRSNHPDMFEMFESAAVNYLVNKTNESAEAFINILNMYDGMKEVNILKECVNMDTYSRKLGNNVVVMELCESALATPEKVYTEDQVKNLISKAVSESRKADEERRTLEEKKTIASLEDMTGLCESINTILKKTRHEKVKSICEHYLGLIHQGHTPDTLTESFISNMGPFGMLNAVDTELQALGQKVSKYKQEINLVKIVEMMKETESYYIVPLIEDAVVDYCKNKCAATRLQLCAVCENFRFDNFVKDILFVVKADQSISNLYLGQAVEVSESCRTQIPFSPVLYVTEGKCIFNAFGNYYTKTGNVVSRLSKSAVIALDESYKQCCNAINSAGVSFNELTQNIEIRENGHLAVISEGRVEVDGNEMNIEVMKTPQFQEVAVYEGLGNFYAKTAIIAENMDTIANLDGLCKRIQMNESSKSVDVFRSGNVISVALNEGFDSRFYENVNPIRCKNLINEHAELNISSMFEDILPNQRLLESEIDEAQSEYEDAIVKLKAKKDEIAKLLNDGCNEEDANILKQASDAIDQELDDLQKNLDDLGNEREKLAANSDKPTKDSNGDDPADQPASDDLKSEVSTPLGDNGESPIAGDVQPDGETLPEPGTEDQFPSIAAEEPNSFDVMTAAFDEFDPVLTATATVGVSSDDSMKVQDISFDRNVKSGVISNRGVVTISVPTVNPNGDIKNEIKTVTFFLGQDRKPVLNNDDNMPLSMYNNIVNAISGCPDIDKVDLGSAPAPEQPSAEQAAPAPLPQAASQEPNINDPMTSSTEAPAPLAPEAGIDEPMTDEVPAPLTSEEPSANFDEFPELGDQANVEDVPVIPSANNTGSEERGLDSTVNRTNDDYVDDENPEDESFLSNQEYKEPTHRLKEPYNDKNNPYVVLNGEEPVEIVIAADDVDRYWFGRFLDSMHKKIDIRRVNDEDGKPTGAYFVKIDGKKDGSNLLKHLTDPQNAEPIHGQGYTKERVFDCYPSMRCFEHLNYPKASTVYRAIFESGEDGLGAVFPYNEDLFRELSKFCEEDEIDVDRAAGREKSIVVIIKTPADYDDMLKIVRSWLDVHRDDVDAEIADKLEDKLRKYGLDGMVSLDNTPEITNQLDRAGLEPDEIIGESVKLDLTERTFGESKKVLSIARNAGIMNESVAELEHLIMLNEGYLITVEDKESGKRLTIDTDDVEKEGKTKEEEEKASKEKDDNSDTTFDDKGSELYDTKPTEPSNGEPAAPAEESVKPKKKFKFKKKVNESVEVTKPAIASGTEVLYKGAKGKVTGVYRDANNEVQTYIVIVSGHTYLAKPSEVKTLSKDNVFDWYNNPDILVGQKLK